MADPGAHPNRRPLWAFVLLSPIIAEGLAVKSFFDPGWKDLGTLGWYGRSLDVNWIWAVWLTIFHAVVSIAIPIFLVECIWPRIRGQPLTSRRGYITAIV